ncbi:hypothetical protein AAFF_G00371380 [Aldrovandia affinis]|uniref:Uncharacterized protein n=1 Tax=Aldrovandia affinis TaxID=143900 RepID=A0AAD7SH53_9TELE|nr:hypothetical protein AAFF_G00371380 [Aldrovandia affinis]
MVQWARALTCPERRPHHNAPTTPPPPTSLPVPSLGWLRNGVTESAATSPVPPEQLRTGEDCGERERNTSRLEFSYAASAQQAPDLIRTQRELKNSTPSS